MAEAEMNVALLKSLKSKRAQIKKQCTRVRTYLDNLNAAQTSVIELRQRHQKFANNWKGFDDVQSKIEEIELEDVDQEDHQEERTQFENKYFSIVVDLETLIEEKNERVVQEVTGVSIQHNQDVINGSMRGNANDCLKLPRINLQEFSGKYEDWISFKNIFTTMIHEHPTLPRVQKMQYLIAALKGEAHDVISSFETSDDNYDEAWSTLKERYDDESLIIQKHIRALFSQPSMVKENHQSLRKLLDNVMKHIRALKALKRPTEQWDDLMIYLVTSRLDAATSKEWETSIKKGVIPKFSELTEFLAQRCRALEASSRTQKAIQGKPEQNKSTAAHVATTKIMCAYCGKADHFIYKCSDFSQLNPDQRIKEARTRKLCLNCLKAASHQAKQCNSGSCRKCDKRHNTLLHLEYTTKPSGDSGSGDDFKNNEKVVAISVNHSAVGQERQVLLATAIVNVLDIKGLGETSTQARSLAKITLQSRINEYQAKLDCLVIDQIAQALPNNHLNFGELQIPNGITLADPKFNQSSNIDLLLGAEIFLDLLCIGKIRLVEDQPVWQKTLFGWIVSGSFMTRDKPAKGTRCNLALDAQLHESMARFWQLEHNIRQNTRTPEECYCEKHYAIQQFKRLERQLERNPRMKKEYNEFMKEYLQLCHMREISQDSASKNVRPHCYLPHHCVIKEGSVTTHLRVVFNVSSKTTTGISLNDALMAGPVVQPDVFYILLTLRIFIVVLIADIAKMYRQILINESQVPLQRIVWREHPNEELKIFEFQIIDANIRHSSGFISSFPNDPAVGQIVGRSLS
ncbi:uncharacterized protein [Temnothorax longispinosus]|uniref:uncharacterized protein n=1 Tax=Temnothorax longispinosus TaxID=300112 RepID=UPI003A9A480F